MTASARARINLSAIKHNFNVIRAIEPAASVMAVIKGNAYGHGMLATARALQHADAFAVARISEAEQLRAAGIDNPLVLFGGVVTLDDQNLAASLDVSLCIHNQQQIDWLCADSSQAFKVWLKIDSGMNRLGFDLSKAADAMAELRACAAVSELGLMTHLANADNPSDDTTRRQIDRFVDVVAGFDGDISIANSGGLFGFADDLDVFGDFRDSGRLWIRPGIALFGVSPLEGVAGAELGLKPAMEFTSRLIDVKQLKRGTPVGYGGEWCAKQDTKIGVVAAGYGDGYSRYMSNGAMVVVGGREVPVVGVISMDLLVVDLGQAARDKVGDAVILWGDTLPVERVAALSGTAAYQLITGVIHREPAVYE